MFLAPPDYKSPYFQVIYKVNGKRTKVSTKTSNMKEAEKFLASFVPPVKEKKEEKSRISLSAFIKEYKIYVGNNFSAKYLKKAVNPSFNVFQKYLPDMPLENISSKIVDQFISSAAAKSKHSASLYYRTIKAAFNKAITWEYIKENPFNKIKPPKVPKPFPTFINSNELQIIIDNTEREFLKPIFYTAFYTGMRLAEILNMKWSWIDFQNDIITVKCDKSFTTKNRKERIIPINSTLRSILLNHQPKIINITKAEFVFISSNGIKFNEDFISKQFKKAVRKAKLNDKIHFHSLRHSFCSNLVQKGVSLYKVKNLAGHQNFSVTQQYSHLQPEDLSQAVNLL
ncbi:MAG: tyrosine-type recombinase/integrase [Ignavibacteriaceae bacterium]